MQIHTPNRAHLHAKPLFLHATLNSRLFVKPTSEFRCGISPLIMITHLEVIAFREHIYHQTSRNCHPGCRSFLFKTPSAVSCFCVERDQRTCGQSTTEKSERRYMGGCVVATVCGRIDCRIGVFLFSVLT